MKKTVTMALAILFSVGVAFAQQPTHQHGQQGKQCENCPHHQQHHGGQQQVRKPAALQYNSNGIETTLATAFPNAKRIQKANQWTRVYDDKDKLLGYGVYSKPASDTIKGYAGETPVLITFDTRKVITGVYALPNVETPKFAQKVADAKFYDQWNGLTPKKALAKEVDAVSGATFTSRSIAASVRAALKTL